jgi:putative PEP-CTERM system histidine kinase
VSLRETALLAGMVVTLIPVAAAYIRHRSGLAWGATVLAALSMSALLAVVWRLIRLGPAPDVKLWVYLLVAAGVPVLLSGYLLSAVLGRESPGAALKSVIRTFVAILGGGALALVFLHRGGFVVGYQWKAGSGTVLLGPLGKAYLSYLLVGLVFVGYNLESTYRLADGAGRERLRPVVLGLFGVLGFYTYVLTTGLLYSAVEIDNLVASAVPLLVASLLVSYGFLKGSLADTAVPVSRTVVYSSFTAFAAALYVLAMGMAAQLASFTRWSPGQVVTVSFVFLVVLAAATLVISNRVQRAVRRFIDRNFYVNRYDYRTQWFRVTRTLEPSQGPEGVAEATETMFKDVFLADGVTVALRDRNGHLFRPVLGVGKGDPEAVLLEESPLIQRLLGERHALLLERQPDDLDYIPIYVENREWLEHTASQVVAPLLVGQELRGIVGLERSHPDDRFSYEDLDLLDCMAAQVAAVMRAVELAQELAEAREMELLSQWSNLILHDLKNYLSPLQLIVQNMRVHMGNPEFQKEAVEDLAAVAGQMERLIKRLSELREGAHITKGTVDINELASRTLTDLQLYRRPSLTVKMELTADEPVRGDAGMLRRVVENLIQNAVEAMQGRGCLTVRTEVRPDLGNGVPKIVLSVADTGPGIDEAFIRDRLFRPFASTKKKGLGLGLYQCRTIVEAHGGEILVESRLGEGTTFLVALMAARRVEPRRLVGAPERPQPRPGVQKP